MRGAWAFAIGSSPGLLFGVWAAWENPFFLDAPWVFLVLACLPGLALALVWRREGPRQLLVVPLALWTLAALRPEPEPVPVKLLVIGIDGASWDRIDALELPHLKALEETGTRAVLESMEPMFSPLLWTTIASGKGPSEHGVKGFRVRSDQARVPRFWDIASQEGYSVGVWKWLVTWPPRPVDGFMVPGWLALTPETTPPDLGFAKELELASRLRRQQRPSRNVLLLALEGIPRGLRMSTLLSAAWELSGLSSGEPGVERNLLRGLIDRDVFVWALHRHQPELATFTTYATDGLQHSHFGLEAADRAYRQADDLVGELLSQVGPETTVVVISDHGFQAFEGPDERLVPTTEALSARLGEGVQVHRLGIKLVLLGPEGTGEVASSLLDEQGQSAYRVEALQPGVWGLTLRREALGAQELARATVDGEPMQDFARPRERHDRGDHHPEGIFLASGPGIGAGERLPPVGLLDVSPTLQALLGIPPALDLPGRIVLGPTTRGPATRDGLIETLDWGAWSPDAPLVDEDALRALGYID